MTEFCIILFYFRNPRHPQRNLQQQIDLQGVWNTKQRVLGSWRLRNLPRSKDFGGISFWIQNGYINSPKKKCCYWPQNVLVLNIKQQSLCIDVILGESLAGTCLTCKKMEVKGKDGHFSLNDAWYLEEDYWKHGVSVLLNWSMSLPNNHHVRDEKKPGRFIIKK